MGIFNIIMTAMGFENEQKKEKKQKKQKQVSMGQSAQFNLNQKSQETKPRINTQLPQASYAVEKESATNVVVYTPKTQKEVQKVCDSLAEGEVALINLTNFAEQDRIRAVDFLSGVAYILKYKIQRIEGSIFFIAPEGVEPMEYEVQ